MEKLFNVGCAMSLERLDDMSESVSALTTNTPQFILDELYLICQQ